MDSQNKKGDISIFVGNMPFSVSEDDVRGMFGAFGEVVSVAIVKDPMGRSKGYGFVDVSILLCVPRYSSYVRIHTIHTKSMYIYICVDTVTSIPSYVHAFTHPIATYIALSIPDYLPIYLPTYRWL